MMHALKSEIQREQERTGENKRNIGNREEKTRGMDTRVSKRTLLHYALTSYSFKILIRGKYE